MSYDNEHLRELFEPLGGVSFRRMFGGVGIFRGGLMFALIADDVLYFKATDKGAAAFEAEGCERWSYANSRRKVAMPYWRTPDRLFDEPQAFAAWAEIAWQAALELAPPRKGTPSRGGNKAPKRKGAP